MEQSGRQKGIVRMEWTTDQQQIIDRRTGTLLVSAAAGSGKTAVLVQRILEWIVQDRKNIDEFLVVTFTKAAAGQMRAKIRAALEELQEADPGDEHLIRQLSLIHRANIMTIDSFCKNIFNEHFHRLHLDPSMRIIDETEGVLMQEDVIGRILETAYEQNAEAMSELHGCLNAVRSNESIVELIKNIHTQASSFPYPEEWYENAWEDLQADTEEAINRTKWVQILLQEVKSLFADVADIPEQVSGEYQEMGSVWNPKNYEKYAAYFQEECGAIRKLMGAVSYRELQEALSNQDRSLKSLTWKNTKVPEAHRITELWNRYAEVRKEAAQYVKAEPEEMVRHQKEVRRVLETILTLSRTFTQEYLAEKQKKNCMDFADVEHYALQILMEERTAEDGHVVRTPSDVAVQLKDSYAEIMIDEYQDSNDLQEAILTSIARQEGGVFSNLFMVGDVKQSIYRFRMARPVLFQDKYNTYDDDLAADGIQKKVELKQNFRSRKEVLESVNLLFYQIMGAALGGIDYNPQVALVPGRKFEAVSAEQEWYGYREQKYPVSGQEVSANEQGLPVNLRTEILMIDSVTEQQEELPEAVTSEEEEDSVEEMTLEARVIAGKIQELCDEEHPLPIWDEKNKSYRSCTYRDIVILLRTAKDYSDTYREVLMEAGIPVYAESGKGYFDSVEVKNILNMLSVIDNAGDDIALTGVLRSPLVGLTEEQLALLRCQYRKQSMWTAVQLYCREAAIEEGELTRDDELAVRSTLQLFVERVQRWKEKKTYCTIRELISSILQETGYYIYLTAMPHGNVRQANVMKLMEKATAYEMTSYRGLFDFLRYIERVRVADQDFGEASVLGSHENLVQIMTIHKSKGLEFPVVILGCCGKQFNEMDTRQPVYVDPDAYLAINDMNLAKHYYEKTEKRECLKRHMIEENLAEEMRILYVAMTRAQEKLILVGSVKKRMADKEEYRILAARAGQPKHKAQETDIQALKLRESGVSVPDKEAEQTEESTVPGKIVKSRLLKCKSYLAWLIEGILHIQNCNSKQDCMEYRIITPDMVDWQVVKEIERSYQASATWQERVSLQTDTQTMQEIAARFGWQYAHAAAATRKGKLSVSEIKKMSQIVDDTELEPEYPETASSYMQANMGSSKTLPKRSSMLDTVSGGADYGTLVHLVMEKLAFTQIAGTEDVEKELQRMVETEILTEEERGKISVEKIYRMVDSSLGRRMTQADRDGHLYKEQQFVIGMPMKEVYPDTDEEDLELIQGIIDAYFEEDGDYVLMDYKTDRVSEAHGAEELIHKYHAQLEYYKRTLEQLTGKRVKEVYIYSFALDKVIPLWKWGNLD